MKIAIIDLGSNSFHMVTYSVSAGGDFSCVCRDAFVNALGRFLRDEKELPQAVIQESAAQVALLQTKARAAGAHRVYAFGTGIFRRLTNTTGLIDEIFKKTGLVAHVLTEREEARMIYQAVRHAYPRAAGCSLMIDIGGGSSEFIYASTSAMSWYKSVPCGTAVLFEEVQKDGAPLARRVRKHYGPVIASLRRKEIRHVYGTAGFFRYTQRWLGKTRDLNRPVRLTRADITTLSGLIDGTGFRKGSVRERGLVRVGSEIMGQIMDGLRLQEVTVSEASTREGYLISRLRRLRAACH